MQHSASQQAHRNQAEPSQVGGVSILYQLPNNISLPDYFKSIAEQNGGGRTDFGYCRAEHNNCICRSE